MPFTVIITTANTASRASAVVSCGLASISSTISETSIDGHGKRQQ